jgi:inner membrane protein
MALCLTHAGAGYLVYEAMRPAGPHRVGLLATAIVLANAPDLDFLPGLLMGTPTVFHRGLTHSLAGVVMVALGAWWCARWARPPEWSAVRMARFAAVAFASHLLVDYFTVDAVPPYGARFLWPVSEAYLHAPVQAFAEIIVDRSGSAAFLASLWGPGTRQVWIRETMTALAFVVAGGLVGLRHGRRRPSLALPS